MCQVFNQDQLHKLLDGLVVQPEKYIIPNKFLYERLKSIIRRHPHASLEYIFYQYQLNKKIHYTELLALFQKLSSECYISYVMFINNLCPGKIFFLSDEVRRVLTSSLEHIIESNKVPITGQNRIMQALYRMKQSRLTKEMLDIRFSLSFPASEVLDNIDYFLNCADTIADLPEFVEIYFPEEDIMPLGPQLENYKLNPFGLKYIKHLITTDKKQQIRKKIKHFIQVYPVEFYAKQAFAVYITLGTSIPWDQHPFFLRIVANSYWEAKIQIRNKQISTT